MNTPNLNAVIHPKYENIKDEIINLIHDFNNIELCIAEGRNTIKLAKLSTDEVVAIKSFKKPNVFNRYVYKFFRKPKAERSFLHAIKLFNLGFNTPQPIAYMTNNHLTRLKESFYISEFFVSDICYRELLEQPDYPNRDEILRKFTEFTFSLHEQGVEFLDHSPGNTLIKLNSEGDYEFFLIDLNRMKFHASMSFNNRMKNLAHLTSNIHDIEQMAEHYAKLIGKNTKEVFMRMWLETIKFQYRFHRKKEIKHHLKKINKRLTNSESFCPNN